MKKWVIDLIMRFGFGLSSELKFKLRIRTWIRIKFRSDRLKLTIRTNIRIIIRIRVA